MSHLAGLATAVFTLIFLTTVKNGTITSVLHMQAGTMFIARSLSSGQVLLLHVLKCKPPGEGWGGGGEGGMIDYESCHGYCITESFFLKYPLSVEVSMVSSIVCSVQNVLCSFMEAESDTL